MVEGGPPDPRRAVPPTRAASRRDPPRLQGAVDVRPPALRRRVLSIRRRRLRPQAGPEAASADLGRRGQPRRLSAWRDAWRWLARHVGGPRGARREPRSPPPAGAG